MPSPGTRLVKNARAVTGPSIVDDPRDCSHDSDTRPRSVRDLSARGLGVLSLPTRPWTLQPQHGRVRATRSTVHSVSSRPPLHLACKARNQGSCSPIGIVQVLSPVSLSAVQEFDLLSSNCFFIRLCTDVQDTIPTQADARS